MKILVMGKNDKRYSHKDVAEADLILTINKGMLFTLKDRYEQANKNISMKQLKEKIKRYANEN